MNKDHYYYPDDFKEGSVLMNKLKRNALHAVAPDLLEACKAIVRWEELPGSKEVAWPGHLHEAIKLARKAIARAEGKD